MSALISHMRDQMKANLDLHISLPHLYNHHRIERFTFEKNNSYDELTQTQRRTTFHKLEKQKH